jgi:hydrogenase-1 operon protein HyaF
MSEERYGGSVMAGDGSARIILGEIARLLESLLETGEGGSIEVSNLPLTDEDYDLLDENLGEGEVSADVMSPGPVHVVETGIGGVWWVTHLNAEDEVLAEFIEVAFCPEILMSPGEDVVEGLAGLKARLFEAHLSESADERSRD